MVGLIRHKESVGQKRGFVFPCLPLVHAAETYTQYNSSTHADPRDGDLVVWGLQLVPIQICQGTETEVEAVDFLKDLV